jgi:pSer/pThr/pTyr-binding forkhead associated (FHA) protein
MESKLILKFKDAVIAEYPLDTEETTIGRKPENTIHIDNLAVSGRHARVFKIGDKAVLEDLGSTNGTFVNDKPISKHVLKHGDAVRIGKHTLGYVELADQTGAEPGPAKPEADKAASLSPQARAALEAKAGKAPMPLGGVQLIAGHQAGRTLELSAALTSIGKGEGCRIRVKGLTVGKQAAVITRRPAGYHIAYVEGMARVRVNGEAIDAQARALKDGDTIEIGDTRMEFSIKA